MSRGGDSDVAQTNIVIAILEGIFGFAMVLLMTPFAIVGMILESLWGRYKHP